MHSNLYPDADSFDRPCCNLPQGDRPAFDPAILAHLMGEQPRLRLILIGYPEDVNREILNLYHCGYDIDDWSSPQRIPGTTEVITVYSDYSLCQTESKDG